MASTAFANSLLPFSSTPRSSRPTCNAFPLSRISLPNSGSHFLSTKLKEEKNFRFFTTYSSPDAASAKDPKEEETPIELSMHHLASLIRKNLIIVVIAFYFFALQNMQPILL